ncbi:transposase [Streptacidiphilus rugosus]|uniref:transposase n=1 Tax=Streptacidiphilus rugosus TaxID=405783 RepID=UPI0018DC0536|nr:transposase [Streptacidiphilus rugosus]
MRTVAVDGTSLHLPEDEQITWRYPKRVGEKKECGYPLLRLLVVVECGARALLAAAFGPEADGETAYAARLLSCLDASMLLLADAAFDSRDLLEQVLTTGAQFLVRSGARRCPAIAHRLPDGSYLSYLPGPLPARTWLPVTAGPSRGGMDHGHPGGRHRAP